jgi:hypothetical protein
MQISKLGADYLGEYKWWKMLLSLKCFEMAWSEPTIL